MAKSVHIRHLRHNRLRGLDRGPSARRRLRHLQAFIAQITTTLNATATATSVTAANAANEFTGTAHGLEVGELVHISATALPVGILAATDYFAIPTGANTFQLAASNGNAFEAVAVPFTTDGTAVQFTRQVTTAAIEALLRAGITVEQLRAATDIDAI